MPAENGEEFETRVQHYSVLVVVVRRERIAGLLGSSGDAQLVAVLHGSAQNFRLPVGALAERGCFLVGIAALVAIVLLLELCPLRGVEQAEMAADVACSHVEGVADAWPPSTRLAALGGYEDNTVGTARTVDGRGRHVLEHLHALYVVGIDCRQRVQTALYAAQSGAAVGCILEVDEAVDDVERLVRGVHRVSSAYAYLAAGTGLSTGCHHTQTCHLPHKCRIERWSKRLLEHIALDSGHAARELGALLGAVANDNHLRQPPGILAQAYHYQRVALAHFHTLAFVAHIAHADV